MKPIFIISGEKESGKTSFLIDILALLQADGFVVAGIVALHDLQQDCYQIQDVKTNEQSPLMQRIATYDKRPNHFNLFAEGEEMGNACIKELLVQPPDIAIMDEIGGYELRGKLWSWSFTQLAASSVPLIFTVKERLLNKVLAKWNIQPNLIFRSVDFSHPDDAFERIKKFL